MGHSHAFTCQRVHGGAFDFFGLAAAGYFGKPMDLRLSFEHYDRVQGEPLGEVGERVHAMIRFETGGSILDRARVGGEALADKMRRKLGWMAEQARRTLVHATGQR